LQELVVGIKREGAGEMVGGAVVGEDQALCVLALEKTTTTKKRDMTKGYGPEKEEVDWAASG
jgi:hypothetical protein